MKTLTIFFTLALTLALATDSTADCVAQPVAVRQQVVSHAAPIAYVASYPVPAYTASYGDGQGLAELIQAIRELRSEVQQLRSGQPQVLQQKATLAGAKCSACHAPDTALSKKAPALIVDGRFRNDLTPEQRGAILDHVKNGTMPRGFKLTDAEKLEIFYEAVAAPAQEKIPAPEKK